MRRRFATWLVALSACGGSGEVSSTAAPADTCLRFTAAPTIVSDPGGPGARDPALAAGPEGAWFLAWRSEQRNTLELRRLEADLRDADVDPETVAPGVIGAPALAADGTGALLAWREGPLLRAWRRDSALAPASPPSVHWTRPGEPIPVAASAASTSGAGAVLIWRGSAAKPPYVLWNYDDSATVPATLPVSDGATATGPGALAADLGAIVAVWPEQAGDAGWSLHTVRLGGSDPKELVAIGGPPTSIDAALGDGILVAWTARDGAHLQRAGLGGAPIGDPLDLGAATRPAVAASGPHELVTWTDGDLRLQRLDRPGCAPATPSVDVAHPGIADVAINVDGHGVVAWEAPAPDGRSAIWARPFEVVDAPSTTR